MLSTSALRPLPRPRARPSTYKRAGLPPAGCPLAAVGSDAAGGGVAEPSPPAAALAHASWSSASGNSIMRLRRMGRVPLVGIPRVRRIARSCTTLTRLISCSSPRLAASKIASSSLPAPFTSSSLPPPFFAPPASPRRPPKPPRVNRAIDRAPRRGAGPPAAATTFPTRLSNSRDVCILSWASLVHEPNGDLWPLKKNPMVRNSTDDLWGSSDSEGDAPPAHRFTGVYLLARVTAAVCRGAPVDFRGSQHSDHRTRSPCGSLRGDAGVRV